MPVRHQGQPGRDSSANQLHRQRQVAESFGSVAERYDRARPGYPAALVERIVAASPGPRVLDVGCGTGIAARQFQAAGCRVLGVDPDPRMAGYPVFNTPPALATAIRQTGWRACSTAANVAHSVMVAHSIVPVLAESFTSAMLGTTRRQVGRPASCGWRGRARYRADRGRNARLLLAVVC
jgi:SAM-dependent methyltransferase